MTCRFDSLQSEIGNLPRVAGISIVDLLNVSHELRSLISATMRGGGRSVAELARELDMLPSDVEKLLVALATKGYLTTVKVERETRYKTSIARKRYRDRGFSILDTLVDETQ